MLLGVQPEVVEYGSGCVEKRGDPKLAVTYGGERDRLARRSTRSDADVASLREDLPVLTALQLVSQ